MDAIKGIVQRVELQGIVTRLTERLSEEGKIVLELKSFGLRTVKLDKEIIFYFHFKTEEDLKCARNAFDSKEMEASAGRDFKSLQLPNNHLSIVLDWSENDFNRCRKYFYHISSTSASSFDILIMIYGLHKPPNCFKCTFANIFSS